MLENRKILLVDDDEDDREIFTDILKEIEPSLELKIAGNGREALEFLSAEVSLPSFILLDLNMPVMNGLECLTILKKDEKFKTIPVVILTTSSNPPSATQALKLGAKLFLTKAANLLDIKSQLKQALEKNLTVAF